MKLNKKILSIFLVAIMIFAVAACGTNNSETTQQEEQDTNSSDNEAIVEDTDAEGSYEVGYVNLANTDVFTMARIDALEEIVEGSDFNVSYTDGNNDNQKQIDQVNSFLAKGVDVLIIVPADSEAIVPAINAANTNNTPVICLGIKASSGDFVYVGSENFDAGYMQGEFFAETLPDNGKVVYLAGTSGLEHSAERLAGFKAALEEKGRDDVEILAEQDGDYVKDEAMRITDAWIQSYSDGEGGVTFDAVVCGNDQMALGAMESLRGAGVLSSEGEVMISGIDGTEEAVQAVIDGFMVQTVLQDAPGQGEAAFEIMQKLVVGEDVEDEIFVPFQSITIDNAADYQ